MRLPARLKRFRHGVYYYRLLVPARLRSVSGGCREFRRSLGTRDPNKAKRLAFYLSARCNEALWGKVDMSSGSRKLDPTMFVSRWEADLDRLRFKADPGIPGDQEELLRFREYVKQNPAVLETLRSQQTPDANEMLRLVERANFGRY